MADLKCPNCVRDFVRPVSRAGLPEMLLSLFYVHPYKCQLCGARFRSFQWGVRFPESEEDQREYDRLEEQIPVMFRGQTLTGEGVLLDLSMRGCRFKTGVVLSPGMILQVGLKISDDLPPVTVEAAAVRSAGSGSVGVEFIRWQEKEQERLRLFTRGLLIGRGPQIDTLKNPS